MSDDQSKPPQDFQVSLGEVLKNRRIALGRSIEQLSALTRIHAKTLKALEENAYSELPARAFTRGFIVSYAKALGLSGDELVKIYHQFLEEKFSERPNKEKGHEGYVFESKELEQNRRWLVILGSVAAVFAMVVLLFFKPQNHKHKEKHKEFTEEANTTPTPSEVEAGAEGLPVVTATPPGVDEDAAAVVVLKNSQSPTPAASTLQKPTINPVISIPPTIAAVASIAKPSPSPSPTPKPSVAASPTPKASATPTATPSASPTDPNASPTPPADPLNKGDDLKPNEVKKRILFESLSDVWVRYQADDKKPMLLMLRKGKFLVIKAKEKLVFDTNAPENLRVRPKNTSEFKNLEMNSLQIGDNGLPTALEGGVQNAPKLPAAPSKNP